MCSSDLDLVQGCILQDRKCQEGLYSTYCDEMFTICMSYAKDYHSAKDIMQDGFVKIFSKIDQYKSQSSLRQIGRASCRERV